MSHSGRPAPFFPAFIDNKPQEMADTRRTPNFPQQAFAARPELRASGFQLPPIHAMQQNSSGYESGSRNVQLPPMRLSQPETTSPSRTTAMRSIPVSQLLSSDPPSPPRQQSRPQTQQTHYGARPGSHDGPPPAGHRPQPLSYPPVVQHRQDQAPMPPRQTPQGYQSEHYARAQYPSRQAQGPPEPSAAQHFSPAPSCYSSPSYAQSETSPRSSMGPPSHSSLGHKPRVSQVPPLNYNLSIRQQPVAARACGFGERDRRVVDPPPIIELKITDRSGMPEQDPHAMLALHCTLLSPDGHDDETELPPASPEMPNTRRLMGTLVASPYQAKDQNGIAGTFFVFPDLSCRSPGKYRLKFRLIRVDPMNMTPGAMFGSVASIVTDVFSVYTAKDFPGMRASSALLKALRRQGLNVGVKKGSEARKGKGKAKKEAAGSASSEDEDESDAGSDVSDSISPRTNARKKGKRRKQNE